MWRRAMKLFVMCLINKMFTLKQIFDPWASVSDLSSYVWYLLLVFPICMTSASVSSLFIYIFLVLSAPLLTFYLTGYLQEGPYGQGSKREFFPATAAAHGSVSENQLLTMLLVRSDKNIYLFIYEICILWLNFNLNLKKLRPWSIFKQTEQGNNVYYQNDNNKYQPNYWYWCSFNIFEWEYEIILPTMCINRENNMTK